jgi:hypothetical protein
MFQYLPWQLLFNIMFLSVYMVSSKAGNIVTKVQVYRLASSSATTVKVSAKSEHRQEQDERRTRKPLYQKSYNTRFNIPLLQRVQ